MIFTLLECPIKSLGMIFNCTLRDTNTVRALVGDLELWLARVDKSGLPGRFKAWIYQHMVLPRIMWFPFLSQYLFLLVEMWPLFAYESPKTIVEAIERKMYSYLQRCLWLPRSLTCTALHGTSNALRLPF